VDQPTLSQQVYEQLHRRLMAGHLRPGARLVNRTLAAELGTSTIPVREAIGRLVSEGLVELTPGAGASVRSPDPAELSELYDVREALEVLAAGEAARHADDALVADLRAVCDRFRAVAVAIPTGRHATPAQFDRWLDAEEDFHTRLVAAARNRWLTKTVRELRVFARVFAAQRAAPKLLTPAVAGATVRHHEAVLDLLVKRDVAAARAWMADHIRYGRATVLGHLAASDPGARSKPGERGA
jgi:DNA-binding GntR family transcriptional regulator